MPSTSGAYKKSRRAKHVTGRPSESESNRVNTDQPSVLPEQAERIYRTASMVADEEKSSYTDMSNISTMESKVPARAAEPSDSKSVSINDTPTLAVGKSTGDGRRAETEPEHSTTSSANTYASVLTSKFKAVAASTQSRSLPPSLLPVDPLNARSSAPARSLFLRTSTVPNPEFSAEATSTQPTPLIKNPSASDEPSDHDLTLSSYSPLVDQLAAALAGNRMSKSDTIALGSLYRTVIDQCPGIFSQEDSKDSSNESEHEIGGSGHGLADNNPTPDNLSFAVPVTESVSTDARQQDTANGAPLPTDSTNVMEKILSSSRVFMATTLLGATPPHLWNLPGALPALRSFIRRLAVATDMHHRLSGPYDTYSQLVTKLQLIMNVQTVLRFEAVETQTLRHCTSLIDLELFFEEVLLATHPVASDAQNESSEPESSTVTSSSKGSAARSTMSMAAREQPQGIEDKEARYAASGSTHDPGSREHLHQSSHSQRPCAGETTTHHDTDTMGTRLHESAADATTDIKADNQDLPPPGYKTPCSVYSQFDASGTKSTVAAPDSSFEDAPSPSDTTSSSMRTSTSSSMRTNVVDGREPVPCTSMSTRAPSEGSGHGVPVRLARLECDMEGPERASPSDTVKMSTTSTIRSSDTVAKLAAIRSVDLDVVEAMIQARIAAVVPVQPTATPTDDIQSILKTFICAQQESARLTELQIKAQQTATEAAATAAATAAENSRKEWQERQVAQAAHFTALQQQVHELQSRDSTSQHDDKPAPIPKIFEYTLSQTEVEKNPLSLDVTKHDRQRECFLNYCSTKHRAIASVVDLYDCHESAFLEEMENQPILRAADSYIARQARLCLTANARSENFLEEFDQHNAAQRCSGYFLFATMRTYNVATTDGEFKALRDRYDSHAFFYRNMTMDQVIKACTDCVKAFNADPSRPKTRFAEQGAILDKLAVVPGLHDDTKHLVAHLKRLRLACMLNVDKEDSELYMPIFKKSIAHTMGVPTKSSVTGAVTSNWRDRAWRPYNNKFGKEANDASTLTDDPESDELCEGCEADRLSDDLEGDAATATKICWDCGAECPTKHPLRQCTAACPGCKLSWCPGARLGLSACVVKGETTLTEQTIIKNAVGNPIHGRGLKVLIRKQESHRQSQTSHKRDAMLSAVEAYASEVGVAPETFISLDGMAGELDYEGRVSDTSYDEQHVLGGALHATPPSPTTCDIISPRCQPSPLAPSEEELADRLISEALPAESAYAHIKASQQGQWIYALVDRGANCNVGVLANVPRYAAPGSIRKISASINGQGNGQATTTNGVFQLPIFFETGDSIELHQVFDSPNSRKFLIDENMLFLEHNAEVITSRRVLRFNTTGREVPLYLRGDHRFWLKIFVPVQDESVPKQAVETSFKDTSFHGLDANSVDADPSGTLDVANASVNTTSTLLTSAARLGLSAEGLKKAQMMLTGLPQKAPTIEECRLIDADVHRKSSIQKRKPAPSTNEARVTEAGHTLSFDGWGPMSSPSIVSGHTYQMVGVCSATSCGHVKNTKEHQEEQWFQFVCETVRLWRSRGHKVFYVKFDRAGELTAPGFVSRVESTLNVTVQFAASKWHEGIATAEVNNDILTRIAEAQCARAGLGPRYILVARKYAQYLLNLRPLRGSPISRIEAATGNKPDVKKSPNYILGCTVIILRDKDDRGPHGSLNRGRTYLAKYLGRDENTHTVEKLDTGAITYPSHCIPVNEHEMVRDSLPPNAALHSIESQTLAAEFPSLTPQSVAQPKPTLQKVRRDAYETGTEIEVQVKVDGKFTWFPATVLQAIPHGERYIYEVDWKGFKFQSDAERNKWARIDLQRADGPEHRLVKAPSPVPTKVVEPPPIHSSTPDGRGDSISLLFGGHSSTIDNVQERYLKRYPQGQVSNLDAKDDPINQDATMRDVRTRYLQRLRNREFRVVFAATPCTTYTPCRGRRMRGKSKEEIWGLRNLDPDDRELLRKHNLLSNFTIEVLLYCENHGIPWMVECSPDRSNPNNDAYWEDFLEWASFWDHGPIKDLLRRGAKRYIVARCQFESPPTAQKYYEFMVCKSLIPIADRMFGDATCTHSGHPMLVRGKTDDGLWVSQQMEEYPPRLADAIAVILAFLLIPCGQTPAEQPPFSKEDRSPNIPPFLNAQPCTLEHRSVDDAIDDAAIAYDGEYSDALDELLSRSNAVDEACAGEIEWQQVTSPLPLAAMEVESLVLGLKVHQPTLSRSEIHNIITRAGGICTLSQVKKVRVGWGMAHAKEQARTKAQHKHLDAAKATQSVIDVKTKVGVQSYKVPATTKQVYNSDEQMFWIDADRSALNSILVGGNCKVRIDTVPADVPIAPVVTARKIKIDQASGELDKFKSRHAADGNRLGMLRKALNLPPSPVGTCNIIDDMALKIFFSDIAARRRAFAKADIGDAYAKGTRTRGAGFMRMPETCREYDADGTEMVIKLVTPIWGEPEAGFEWDAELHERLLSIGWRQCEGVPAMYYFNSSDGDCDCRLIKIVDDLGFSDSSPNQRITKATIDALKDAYMGQVTFDLAPTSFAGYKVTREVGDASGDVISLSQTQKIVEAVRKYLPDVLDGVIPTHLPTGSKLDEMLDKLVLPKERTAKLNPDQKTLQKILGDLKYVERGTMPRLTRRCHRLSCIMSFPPPEALPCAQAILLDAYNHRDDCISFGRNRAIRETPPDGKLTTMRLEDGAPRELEVTADASTAATDVYGILMTRNGGSVMHVSKKVGLAVASTYEAESVASLRASEHAAYARIVEAALGVPSSCPTTLLTDNLATQRVAQNAQAAARSRHFLIRLRCVHQRIADGAIRVWHIPDPVNPSDFLTKAIGTTKTNASIAYAMGKPYTHLS